MFTKWWYKFLSIGIGNQDSFPVKRKIKLLNATLLIACSICIVLAFQAFMQKRMVPAQIQLFRVLGLIGALSLNYYRKLKYALFLFIFTLIASNFLFLWLVPYGTGNFLVSTLIYIFLFYFFENRKTLNISFWLIAIYGLGSFYYEMIYLTNQYPSVYIVSYIAFVLILYFIMSYYKEEVKVFSERLRLSNDIMYTRNEQINKQREEILAQKEQIELQHLKLLKREKYLQEAQRIARLGTWEYDPASDILNMSRLTCEIFGINYALNGKPPNFYFPFFSKSVQVLFLTQYRRFLKTKEPFELELAHERSDGELVYIAWQVEPELSDHKIIKVIGTIRDITSERRYVQKLEQINDSKDRILATVAHDLRGPINRVKGLVDILKLQSGDKLDEDDKQLLDLMVKSCSKGGDLINEILEIAQLEDDHYQLETKKTNLSTLIQDCLEDYKDQLVENGLHLRLELEEDAYVMLNIPKFIRVLDNLLSNSIKFTPESGHISVSVKEDILNNLIILQLSDSGVGIPPDMLATLFDKFSKAGREGLKGEKSTGLGMSIVKQIIELHNGLISVDSQIHKGTSFQIVLPKAT